MISWRRLGARGRNLLWAGLLALAVLPAQAATSAQRPHATVSVALQATAKAGTTDWVAVHLTMAPHWHSYWRNPGETGLPTRIAWTLPKGVAAGPISWPVPQRFSGDGIVDYGYENAVTLLVPLTVAPGARLAGQSATADIHWLLCADMCVPQSATLQFTLNKPFGDAALFAHARDALPRPFSGHAHYRLSAKQISLTLSGGAASGATAPQFFPATPRAVDDAALPKIRKIAGGLRITFARARHAKPFAAFDGVLVPGPGRAFAVTASAAPLSPPPQAAPQTGFAFGILGAALFAFLGGLVLNLMPCVLPILSMKALALVQSGERAQQMRRDGLLYAAGVLVSFALMAGILIGLKSAGAAIGWGFQLQSPLLILILWLLTAAIGLNLLGVFEVPLSLAGIGGGLVRGESGAGAFFTGVLAVLVASPCTAPFMGAALGFAMTQPPLTAFGVFLALGLGFAAPLTGFTFIPALARLIPRPGPWMIRFKEFLAFPMLATAIWLLWVLEQQTGASGLVLALGIALGLVFLVWLVRLVSLPVFRWLFGAGGLAGLAFVALALQPSAGHATRAEGWRPWSQDAVAAARAAGHPVLVDFSAAWCVTCLVNERVALQNPAILRQLARDRVVTLKGDWTNRDAAITALLAKYGRAGVPLYLLYPADKSAQPVVLPQILTPGAVSAALVRLETPAG